MSIYGIPVGAPASKDEIARTDLAPDIQSSLDKADNSLSQNALQDGINIALAQAKEGGEFDGIPGDPGVYTGSDTPPEEATVWINPNDEPDVVVKSVNGMTPDENGNVEIEVENKTPRIETSEAITTLEPNKYYMFPEMAILDITLGGEVDSSILQEYSFRFTSGATATTLVLPEAVKGDLTVEANKIYEVSIVDNLLAFQSWEVA